MQEKLLVTINEELCDRNRYYTLYADGIYERKEYDKANGETVLVYPGDAVVFLYYTYPMYRVVYAVRNSGCPEPYERLRPPGTSRAVRVLFSQTASRVDKTKRAVFYLNRHFGGAYRWSDYFYLRIGAVLRESGVIDYGKIRALAEAEAGVKREVYLKRTGTTALRCKRRADIRRSPAVILNVDSSTFKTGYRSE